MSYNAWFQCIGGCPGQYSLVEVIYRCPKCGDLLEVRHDMAALASMWLSDRPLPPVPEMLVDEFDPYDPYEGVWR